MTARPPPSVALTATLQRALARAQAAAGKLILAQKAVEATPEFKLATDVHAAIERFHASTKGIKRERGRRG